MFIVSIVGFYGNLHLGCDFTEKIAIFEFTCMFGKLLSQQAYAFEFVIPKGAFVILFLSFSSAKSATLVIFV